MNNVLDIFYEEPQNDRWIKYDRYPRALIRSLLRPNPPIGGVKKWFVNLCLGLDQLGINYQVNNYTSVNRSKRIACVVGKPHVLSYLKNDVPIIYGPGLGSHPSDTPNVHEKNVRAIVLSCDWMKKMFEPEIAHLPFYVWPAGIETQVWKPSSDEKSIDVAIYDKIRWERDYFESALIQPIIDELTKRNLRYEVIRYGAYKEEELLKLTGKMKSMIFLCEHETQGFAYQQVLSAGVPILAWDRGGYWKDPYYFPNKVKFGPVTSVPYWDDRCGLKFKDLQEFQHIFDSFTFKAFTNGFKPREYILDNLTLPNSAEQYLEIYREIENRL